MQKDDVIYRQAAIDAVAKWFYDVFGITESDGTATIFKRLRDLQPAQPQRNSGQLLYHHTENIDEMKTADVYFCSFCKKEVLKKIRFGMFSGELDIKYGYCPHCGADIRGESDEHND